MTLRTFLLATALAASPVAALAEDRLPVVASFSILGDMVSTVGGARVAVTTIVPVEADAHVYQPVPADARAMAGAAVIFVNGLGFEGWLDRLVEASGATAPVVVVTEGVTPLETDRHGDDHAAHEGEDHDHGHAEDHADHADGHDHGGVDPHAWQSLANARAYVDAIAAGLSDADPAGARLYAANAADYLAQIDALEAEIEAAVAALPPERRVVVTSHDAFGYFGDAYGLTFESAQGLSTDSEPSAADVAALIRQIRDENIPAVFVERVGDPRLLEQITRETGATVGGALYSDALSRPDGPAPTYLEMMRHNMLALSAALGA